MEGGNLARVRRGEEPVVPVVGVAAGLDVEEGVSVDFPHDGGFVLPVEVPAWAGLLDAERVDPEVAQAEFCGRRRRRRGMWRLEC